MDIRIVSALLNAARIFRSNDIEPCYAAVQEFYGGCYSIAQIKQFYKDNHDKRLDNIRIPRSIEWIVIRNERVYFLLNWLGYPDTDFASEAALVALEQLEASELRSVVEAHPDVLNLIFANCDAAQQLRLQHMFSTEVLIANDRLKRQDYAMCLNVIMLEPYEQLNPQKTALEFSTIEAFVNAFRYSEKPPDFCMIAHYYKFEYTPEEIQEFYAAKKHKGRPSNEYAIRRFRKIIAEEHTLFYFVDWYGFGPSAEKNENYVSIKSVGVIADIFALDAVTQQLQQIAAYVDGPTLRILSAAGIDVPKVPHAASAEKFEIELEAVTNYILIQIQANAEHGVLVTVACSNSANKMVVPLLALESAAAEDLFRLYEYEMFCILMNATPGLRTEVLTKYQRTMPPAKYLARVDAFEVFIYVAWQQEFNVFGEKVKHEVVKEPPQKPCIQLKESVSSDSQTPVKVEEKPKIKRRRRINFDPNVNSNQDINRIFNDRELCFELLMEYL